MFFYSGLDSYLQQISIISYFQTSVIDGLKECLKNYRPSVTKYYVLVHIGDNNELSFHLFLSGKYNSAKDNCYLSGKAIGTQRVTFCCF